MAGSDRSVYRSYLLRLCRYSPHGPWRVSLQDVITKQIHHFASADEMWVFLQVEMVSGNCLEADPNDLDATTVPDPRTGAG